jgi:hypothetical protein
MCAVRGGTCACLFCGSGMREKKTEKHCIRLRPCNVNQFPYIVCVFVCVFMCVCVCVFWGEKLLTVLCYNTTLFTLSKHLQLYFVLLFNSSYGGSFTFFLRFFVHSASLRPNLHCT